MRGGRRLWLLVLLAPGACSSRGDYQNFVAAAHGRYEAHVFSLASARIEGARGRRGRLSRRFVAEPAPAPVDRGVVLAPVTPVVGSPEYLREREQSRRAEEALKRSMRICGGC